MREGEMQMHVKKEKKKQTPNKLGNKYTIIKLDGKINIRSTSFSEKLSLCLTVWRLTTHIWVVPLR